MTTKTTNSVKLRRHLPAAPERVFSAWTEPDQMRHWAAPEGVEVANAEVDLRVGGAWRIEMHAPDGQRFIVAGTYREVAPPTRLVYTWQWQHEGPDAVESLVTVEFRASGDGTEIVVTHEQLADADDAARHEQGWTSCLNRLEKLAG